MSAVEQSFFTHMHREKKYNSDSLQIIKITLRILESTLIHFGT